MSCAVVARSEAAAALLLAKTPVHLFRRLVHLDHIVATL